jgi:hypothetical protein
MVFFLLQETFSPMLLQRKAASLHRETGDSRFKSHYELQKSLFKNIKTGISGPLIFFTCEPIIIALRFYLKLIYVLVFTFLDDFTFIFVDFSPGMKGTAFCAIVVGVLLNVVLTPI